MLKKEKKSDYVLEMLEARFEIAKLRWEGAGEISSGEPDIEITKEES